MDTHSARQQPALLPLSSSADEYSLPLIWTKGRPRTQPPVPQPTGHEPGEQTEYSSLTITEHLLCARHL